MKWHDNDEVVSKGKSRAIQLMQYSRTNQRCVFSFFLSLLLSLASISIQMRPKSYERNLDRKKKRRCSAPAFTQQKYARSNRKCLCVRTCDMQWIMHNITGERKTRRPMKTKNHEWKWTTSRMHSRMKRFSFVLSLLSSYPFRSFIFPTFFVVFCVPIFMHDMFCFFLYVFLCTTCFVLYELCFWLFLFLSKNCRLHIFVLFELFALWHKAK